MSKNTLYCLTLCTTYATLDKGVFRAGVGYTSTQLGSHAEDTNDYGEPYFSEVEEGTEVVEDIVRNEVVISKKSLVINKKSASSATTTAAPHEDAKVGGVDPDTVTV